MALINVSCAAQAQISLTKHVHLFCYSSMDFHFLIVLQRFQLVILILPYKICHPFLQKDYLCMSLCSHVTLIKCLFFRINKHNYKKKNLIGNVIFVLQNFILPAKRISTLLASLSQALMPVVCLFYSCVVLLKVSLKSVCPKYCSSINCQQPLASSQHQLYVLLHLHVVYNHAIHRISSLSSPRTSFKASIGTLTS